MRKLLATLVLYLCAWAALAESNDHQAAMSAAADGGDAKAEFDLGTMYYIGQGVPQDYSKAVMWWRRAADQGYAETQMAPFVSTLGFMYDTGQGVPQDYAEAIKWYRKAADQGYAKGQSQLGAMYGIGHGVPQDFVEAHKWSNLATARAADKETRERAAQQRDLLAGAMTPAEVAEAQRLAREWKPSPVP